jgi:hypothetical protein
MIVRAAFICALAAAPPAFAQTERAAESAAADEPAVSEIEATGGTAEEVPRSEQAISDDNAEPAAAAESAIGESSEPAAEPKAKKKKSAAAAAETAAIVDETAELAEPKAKKKKGADETAAPAIEETRFKLSGLLQGGVDVINRIDRSTRESNTEYRPIGRGEIEISARPVRKLRAEFGIEYNMRDTFIVIDKMYAQYSLPGDGTIRAGIMKKSFGLEERAGVDERYFHSRSIINDGLESQGYLDHDLTAMYRYEPGKAWRFAGALSWSAASPNPEYYPEGPPHYGAPYPRPQSTDTINYFQNYSVHYRTEKLDVILAAVVKHFVDRGPRGWYTTDFAASLSGKYAAAPWWVSEAELTLGSNALVNINRGRNSYIYGIRAQEYFPIGVNTSTLRQIIPIVETAVYSAEDDRDDERVSLDTQIRAGLTLGFTQNSQLQFRNTYGIILRTRDGETMTRRHRFDSHVIVIF